VKISSSSGVGGREKRNKSGGKPPPPSSDGEIVENEDRKAVKGGRGSGAINVTHSLGLISFWSHTGHTDSATYNQKHMKINWYYFKYNFSKGRKIYAIFM